LTSRTHASAPPLNASSITIIIVLALFGAADVRAESPETAVGADSQTVEEIVITGTRRPVPRSQIGSSISVIDEDMLRLSQQQDIAELLRTIPGFELARTGSRGGVSSVFVRGGESDQNLILIDGIQVNRSGGSFDLATLSTDGLERIEIIRGPASALYGSDAVASVIHLISPRGEGPLRGSLRALAGSGDTHEVGINFSGGNDRFGYSLGAGRYATDGVNSLNNDADDTTVRVRLDLVPLEALQFKWTASYADSAFDFPTDFRAGVRGGFPAVDPDQGRRTLELSSGLEIAWQMSDKLEHRLLFGHSDAEDRSFDGLDRNNESDFTDRKSDTDQDRTSAEYRLSWHAWKRPGLNAFITLGYEYERQRFDQRTRNLSLDGTRTQHSATERRDTSAAFFQTDWAISDRLFLSAGARIDDNSEYGSEITPIGTLSWALPEWGARLHAAVSRGIKEPAVRENFGTPGSTDGNPDLRPETSRSAELGIEQRFLGGLIQTGLTWFRTDYDDLIGFVSIPNLPSGAFGTFINVQEVRSQGIEAQLRLALTPDLTLSANYTFLRTRVRDGEAAPNFVRGEDLLRRPTHSGSVSLSYAGDRVDLQLSSSLLGSRADRDDGQAPVERVRNDDRWVVNLAASYLLRTDSNGRETRLLLRIDNLLDEDAEEAFGFESPGRTYLGGVELRF